MSQCFYPAGTYVVKVLKQGFTKAGTGTLQLALYVRVLRQSGEEGAEVRSLLRTVEFPITDKTVDRLAENLRSLGFEGKSLFELHPNHDRFTFDLKDREIELYCKHETYKEKLHEKWQFPFHGKGKGGQKEIAEEERIAAMDAIFAKAMGAESPTEPEPAETKGGDFF